LSESAARRELTLAPLTAAAMLPFGEMIAAAGDVGERSVYTKWLSSGRVGTTPRLHVNHLSPTALPYEVGLLERHLYSAQVFLPLDVLQYVVVVAPSAEDGRPLVEGACAFLAPGNVGVVYAAGTWHAGATVVERAGSFGVLMWRNDSADDEEFVTLASPLYIRR
jgi:ureidoglycolate lyase